MIHLAIDPGTKTGYAEYDTETGKLYLETVDFWTCYRMIKLKSVDDTVVHIEVPNVKKNWQGNKAAIDVGGVIKEAKLLAEGIERLGFKVKRHHPQGKVDAARFNRITGYKGRSNQHTRDAGMLAFRANK